MDTLQIIPLVMILTGAIKSFIPKEYIQLVAILIGLGLAFAFNQDVTAVLTGVLGGVGAVGAYDVSKGFSKAIATDTNATVKALQELIK